MTIAELHKQPAGAPLEDIFSLPADAFVDAWAKALDLAESELPLADRLDLANAIRGGTNRLRIIDALKARSPDPAVRKERFELHAIRREPDQFAVLENFVRFAPEDDAAFLRYSFSRICGREPTSVERLGLEFDLRRRVIERADVVKKIVSIARSDGREAVWDTLLPENEDGMRGGFDPSCARIMPAELLVNLEGRETIVFAREVERVGWMIGPALLCQPLNIIEKGWAVHPGWLLTGPKRSFAEGAWLLDLDLIQDENARLDVEVVANSGLDFLQSLTLAGSFSGTLCFDIKREHRFIELRLRVHDREAEARWLRPRNISMRRAS